jgi:hypothetical protein
MFVFRHPAGAPLPSQRETPTRVTHSTGRRLAQSFECDSVGIPGPLIVASKVAQVLRSGKVSRNTFSGREPKCQLAASPYSATCWYEKKLDRYLHAEVHRFTFWYHTSDLLD